MRAGTPRSQPPRDPRDAAEWRERAARLYEDLRRPARAMVRRAFGSAFGDHEIEDVYASAWLGTLRALDGRHSELSDDEIRRYLLTAVAHHASKELRRRKRKPIAPLDDAGLVPDGKALPEERVAGLEQARVTRDVLGTLPPRRRAVMLFRYGMGLDPGQVRALVKGLSPRAYRKEVTRGVNELAEKLALVERGDWCAEREPVLKAFAAGLADDDQRDQARRHLAHCRPCSGFVAKLSGHLNDVGSWLALPAGAAMADGHRGLASRAGDLVQRVRDTLAQLMPGHPDGGADAASAGGAIAGARGAGAAGGGVLAKLAGLGGAGKLAAVCLGSGAAVTACLAAGFVPVPLAGDDRAAADAAPAVERRAATRPSPAPPPWSPGHVPAAAGGTATEPSDEPVEPRGDDETEKAAAAPPAEQEFGLAGSSPAPGPAAATATADPEPSGDRATAASLQFGP